MICIRHPEPRRETAGDPHLATCRGCRCKYQLRSDGLIRGHSCSGGRLPPFAGAERLLAPFLDLGLGIWGETLRASLAGKCQADAEQMARGIPGVVGIFGSLDPRNPEAVVIRGRLYRHQPDEGAGP